MDQPSTFAPSLAMNLSLKSPREQKIEMDSEIEFETTDSLLAPKIIDSTPNRIRNVISREILHDVLYGILHLILHPFLSKYRQKVIIA